MNILRIKKKTPKAFHECVSRVLIKTKRMAKTKTKTAEGYKSLIDKLSNTKIDERLSAVNYNIKIGDSYIFEELAQSMYQKPFNADGAFHLDPYFIIRADRVNILIINGDRR